LDSNTLQPNNTEYEIELTPLALEMLVGVKDKRHQQILSERIDKLKTDPEKQGKALTEKLKGFRSVRAIGQRYRIIYKIEFERVVIVVVGLGLRKEGDRGDIYTLLQKLLEE
jgi:mRNA interferase RelE/StbE